MSMVQGGRFGSGFASAGLGSALNPAISAVGDNTYAQTFMAAVVGGTVSEAAGGKFANGAVTAAFSYAFGSMARNSAASGQGSGSSGAATLPRGQSRGLTGGEVSMAEEVFFDDIDYGQVNVFNKKFAFFQPSGIAMSPNGSIYFHPDDYLDDFSLASVDTRAWFMHEMTHVWQKQQGMNVMWLGATNRNYSYLPLAPAPPGRSFYSFGIEQQGEIVRDYYMLRSGYSVPGAPPISAYQSVLPFHPW
jgi:hypothetical protein